MADDRLLFHRTLLVCVKSAARRMAHHEVEDKLEKAGVHADHAAYLLEALDLLMGVDMEPGHLQEVRDQLRPLANWAVENVQGGTLEALLSADEQIGQRIDGSSDRPRRPFHELLLGRLTELTTLIAEINGDLTKAGDTADYAARLLLVLEAMTKTEMDLKLLQTLYNGVWQRTLWANNARQEPLYELLCEHGDIIRRQIEDRGGTIDSDEDDAAMEAVDRALGAVDGLRPAASSVNNPNDWPD